MYNKKCIIKKYKKKIKKSVVSDFFIFYIYLDHNT